MSSGERASGLVRDTAGLCRCWWCGEDPQYIAYHDREWGRPTGEDRRLFEKICLEGFQAGLSWLIILRKQENFRRAFLDFDFERIARFTYEDVDRLLADSGIVRHRGKIQSAVNNARRACDLAAEAGSLAAFFWRFEPDPAGRPRRLDFATLKGLASTPESAALGKELKRRGWSFVGPTTVYAFMQAMGLVNDHLSGCAMRAEVEAERTGFIRP